MCRARRRRRRSASRSRARLTSCTASRWSRTGSLRPAARTATHWHDEDDDDWDHDHGDESSDDDHKHSDDEDVRPRWAPPAPAKKQPVVTVTPASPAKPLWTPPAKTTTTTTLGFSMTKPTSSLASSVDWSSLDDDDDEDEDGGLASSLAAMSFKVTPATPAAATAAMPADKARQESLDSALGNSLPAVPQAAAAAKGKYVPPSKRTAQYASPVMTRIGGFLAPPARK
ncbi:hypothetical protein AMAG_19999 [Allomyces macrogynus ATCC 38327]|uniref:Uncharacterized protein n=1 Tax=Allomyces macrogynus (strain ATCC 38327) TaxID=578462 RepID=A0A0L0T4F6_ALLM3|nr:hypothetical protein AMAG_19999 [Allomyces macrogynus ATCC 38327]|eukprot:KNE69586.1 hypothetical protein AMAG_19999 [Allomyces macrogynus ATCC 38327]